MSKDFISRVIEWNKAAGNTDDRFNVRQTAMYIGLVLEEVSELIDSLGDDDESLYVLANRLHEASLSFRGGKYDASVEPCNRLEMLDATADILVVATGLAMSQGADVHGALDNVCTSNESKPVLCLECGCDGYVQQGCTNCNGRGWILKKDATGKIIKGDSYMPPSLKQFIYKEQ